MNQKTHHFRIGLFVLCGAALFVGSLFAMGLRSYFGEHDIYETVVSGKVENLSVGALVKLRGITIGKVRSIEFAGEEYPQYKERYVVIQFEIPKGTIWGADADNIQQTLDGEAARGLRARVQSQGFLGANIVALEYVNPALYPVEPIPWKPQHYYIPSAPNQFNRVLSSLEKTLRNTEDLDLARLFDRAETLIEAANRLAVNLDQIDFNKLGTNANSLVAELRDTNHGLQTTLADAQRTLTDAQTAINGVDLPGLRRDTGALEAKLSGTALELHHVLGSVDTDELNSSLANVRAATDELIALLHKLRERPSSVLFSKSPEPAPELDKPPKK